MPLFYRSQEEREARAHLNNLREDLRTAKLNYGSARTEVKIAQAKRKEQRSLVKTKRLHAETNAQGTDFVVLAHTVEIRSHPHKRGEHSGRCTPDCRAGRTPHLERRARRRRSLR